MRKDFLICILAVIVCTGLMWFEVYYSNREACDEAKNIHGFQTKETEGFFSTCYVKVPGYSWVPAKSYRSQLTYKP